ncbi:MAG: hypothetical protein K9W46_12165 [Candidatus Heimdallarchaeum endolithica]|uniref:Uncharacterized protein n=1 Tax=Candidatus Heimdallarchaeum endolithica TaxID=2876572 RepID=A0A9Y1BQN8_9ARCH|nr:MAG: hypothetical protein K9W46_12165 [Candidatus Heimdallarchaeum endolithica]
MGRIHDTIAENVALNLRNNLIFGKRYVATNVPIFPRPDFVLLSISKSKEPPIAFEVKPPHANKREYLTGLGQTISYLQYYPSSYLVIPQEEIDGFYIPDFMYKTIEAINTDAIGLISYDLKTYNPDIEKKATLLKKTPKEIKVEYARPWLFWMDTSIREVGEILCLVAESNDAKIIERRICDEVFKKRYSGSKKFNSYFLNYSLFFSSLELWTADRQLTVIGNRLREIYQKYGDDSKEFKNALHYLILTTGGYLRLIKLVQEAQDTLYFNLRGDANKLIKEIRELREKEGVSKSEDLDKILPIFEKRGDEWLRLIACKALKEGYGRDLTQILDDISRRFSPYFNKKLETDFLKSEYKNKKGYLINWDRITTLLEEGENNLRVF